MRPLGVVVRSVGGEHSAQVSFPQDQHAIGEFGADGQHEAFGEAVRSRTAGRDLDHLDARIREHGVERGRELSGAVADQESELGGALAEVHDEVAGLLGGPGPVGVFGDAQDVQGAVADFDHEQDVESPQGECAVDVEEVDGQHAGGLGAQELSPAGVGVPHRCQWDPVALENPADRGGADIHLIRNTFRLASRADHDAIKKDLRVIYTAPTADAAEFALEEFEEKWGKKYRAIIRLWRNAWNEFVPFLDYDVEIRRVICSTNAIESLNARYRRAVRARGHFPTEQAALKCLYLVTRSLDPTGTGRTRWTMRWKPVIDAFAITFSDRWPGAETY
jgi:hypothetical protein